MTRSPPHRAALPAWSLLASLVGWWACAPLEMPPGGPSIDVAQLIQKTWNFDDPVASEARFRDLAKGAAEPDRAQLETQVARALALQGRFDAAVAALDDLEPALDSLPDVVRVRWLLERGRCLRSGGSRDAARPLFLEAWTRSRDLHLDPLAIDAAHMVALTMDGGDALTWNLRALELAKTSPDPLAQRWRTSIYNNLAWTYHDLGDYDRALVTFRLASKEARAFGDPTAIRIAEWSVGRALRSLGRYPEALALQRQLDRSEVAPDGYVLEEIAENLLALGRTDEAAPYFARAAEELAKDSELVASEPARFDRLRRLGGPASERTHD